jgi:hypothetical protein
MMQGWSCPKCGNVWSPFTSGCSTCAQPTRAVLEGACRCGHVRAVHVLYNDLVTGKSRWSCHGSPEWNMTGLIANGHPKCPCVDFDAKGNAT